MEEGGASSSGRGRGRAQGRGRGRSKRPRSPEGQIESEATARLSLLPPEDRRARYLAKFQGTFVIERSLDRNDFAGFGIIPGFRALGWEGILEIQPVYYPTACIDFISGIESHNTQSITSLYRGTRVTFSLEDIREAALIDTMPPYEYKWLTLRRHHSNFYDMVSTITGMTIDLIREGLHEIRGHSIPRSWLTPRARIFQKLVESNLNPRTGNLGVVRDKDVFILYSLITGQPRYSLAYMIMESWWDALEDAHRKVIPFCTTLSRLLRRRCLIAPYQRFTDGLEVGDKIVTARDQRVIMIGTFTDLIFDPDTHSLSLRVLPGEDPRITTTPAVTPDELAVERTPLRLPGGKSPVIVYGPVFQPGAVDFHNEGPADDEMAVDPPVVHEIPEQDQADTATSDARVAAQGSVDKHAQIMAAIADIQASMEGRIDDMSTVIERQYTAMCMDISQLTQRVAVHEEDQAEADTAALDTLAREATKDSIDQHAQIMTAIADMRGVVESQYTAMRMDISQLTERVMVLEGLVQPLHPRREQFPLGHRTRAGGRGASGSLSVDPSTR